MSTSRFKEYDPTQCLNCDTYFDASTTFCPNCGQKNRKSELTIREWISEGISTFFHLEGKSWNTLRDLPVPGRLAHNYFNGKRKRYVHPFRLLVFSSLICLLTIQLIPERSTDNFTFVNIGDDVKKNKANALSAISPDSLSGEVIESFTKHPIGKKLKTIDVLRSRIVAHDRFRMLADSMEASGYACADDLLLLDSLRRFFPMPDSWAGKGYVSVARDTLDFDPRKMAYGSPQEVVEDQEYDSWAMRMLAKKVVHIYQDGSDSINQYLFSNLSWAILLYVPFLAFGYKILYRKKLKYYTQHLTYSSILMSVALLLYAIGLGLAEILNFNAIMIVVFGLFIVYCVLGDRKVYDVSTLHVILKSAVLSFYGLFAFITAVVIWFLGVMVFA